MINDKVFNNYLKLFLLSLLFCAIYYLNIKKNVGNDSTISEWLINYQGGFTRRGLIGEICYNLATFFDISLRQTIFLFQSTLYTIYLYLFYNFVKDIPKSLLTVAAIFSPIFLLYHVGELEILVRKEIFSFVGFLIFLNLYKKSKNINSLLIYNATIFPVIYLIWEPFIIFSFFILFILFIKMNYSKYYRDLTGIILSFIPTLIVIGIILIYPLTSDNHAIMAKALMDNFGERCYMSCALLQSKASIGAQFQSVKDLASVTVILRYLTIILVGFLPLLFLLFYSKLSTRCLLLNRLNNLLTLSILLAPSILLFAAAGDWGRWVNIMYTMSLFLYLFLVKNNLLDQTNNFEFIKNFYNKNKKSYLILFFIFAFFWNPKTSVRGDVATNTLYKVVYNTSKHIGGWGAFRIYQDSIFSIWHHKYFEKL